MKALSTVRSEKNLIIRHLACLFGCLAIIGLFALTSSAQTNKKAFDFDGDGKADVAAWNSTTGTWQVRQSSNGSLISVQWGASGDRTIPADYDNDGKTDYAVWTPSSGIWSIKQSSNNQTLTQSWGAPDDIPVPADFDGDGKADIAVWRPSTGVWYIVNSSNGTWYGLQFGDAASGDIPVPGNYDTDNKADVAVWRESNGYWYVYQSSNAAVGYFLFGQSGDRAVTADYDGDGRTDYAVWRPADGMWYVTSTGTGAFTYAQFGSNALQDVLVPADYDGDGKADFALWRPSTGIWHIWQSSNSTLWSWQLGTAGQAPVPAAFIKQTIPPPPAQGVTQATIAKARLSPRNTTGGTNLYSQNFSWGTNLVSLPGRAGMDAGLSISYNSLVWTKVGSTMVFDPDVSDITPGFRFGFPVIEPSYVDVQTNKPTYLMVTPSGARVELRQTATTNVYESVDSSYLQLQVTGSGLPENQQLLLRLTDGTQMIYEWRAGAYRCSQIKDRNGNIVTVEYDQSGLLRKITDTLNRVINVNYSGIYPTSITQTWKTNNGVGTATTHTYATFTYTTKQLSTNFGTLAISGATNGANLKVLDKITFGEINSSDAPSTAFEYNGYGQVQKVINYAADGHILNYVRTNLGLLGTAVQTDCPRLKQTINYVENFSGQNGIPQEIVTDNTFEENKTCPVASLNVPATKVTVSTVGAPHGVSSTMWYHPAGGWTEGLPFATQDFGDNIEQRWTVTSWTQENPSLAYLLNPRVTESKVGDSTNIKRTEMDYYTTATNNYGLVKEVRLYDGIAGTLLKKVTTTYQIDPAYVSRRVIGLPVQVEVSGLNQQTSALELISKTVYGYDSDNFSGTGQNLTSLIQHDNTYYGASFTAGRGNLTSATRHTVSGTAGSTISTTKYNTAGAVVSQTDPLNRTVSISYTDSFNDNVGRNTFAYPTTVTDPASNFSTVKYRYDTGANVRAESPAPHGHTQGKVTTRVFDDLQGRLMKNSIWKKNAQGNLQEYTYSRYEYPSNGVQSKVYSTVTDANQSGAGDGGDEVLTESWLDGAGRVYQSRTPLTFNSSGNPATWAGQQIRYDILGQVTKQSVPAEVDGNWGFVGDETGRVDWLWTRQKYDWKGRVTRKINTDGLDTPDNQPNASDILIDYQGCGCAGGQITTIQGELVPKDDDSNSYARRTQKVYEDILGRTKKTEAMKWNGTTPYLTTVTEFNGRDQALSMTQIDENSTAQVTTMSYDGYGRLKTQHRPEQSQGAVTTYNYNNDDSIQSVVDARGASTVYAYNSRGLLEQLSYSKPTGSDIELPTGVTYGYDAVGNRISMNDGLGNVSYEYDQLSQMTAETRHFSDLLNQAPHNGSYRIDYTYHLSGQLASLKEPFGVKTKYNLDRIGRLTSVAPETAYGTAPYSVTTVFAQNAQYTAWGALKHLEYGNGTQMNQTFFSNKLQAETYQLTDGSSQIMSKSYDYYADGKLRHVQDNLNYRFNRLDIYDHAGRIKHAKSSSEADGQTVIPDSYDQTQNLPYRQSYTYNAFGDMTERYSKRWGADVNLTNTYTMTNHKVMNTGWQYDADGRATKSLEPVSGTTELAFNAAGQLTKKHDYTALTINESKLNRYYDGDGREGKRTDSECYVQEVIGEPPPEQCSWNGEEINYYVRSTMLGGETISEVSSAGLKIKSYVRVGGQILAHLRSNHIWQQGGSSSYDAVYYEQMDTSGMSLRTTKRQQPFGYGDYSDELQAELDSGGTNLGLVSSYNPPSGPSPSDFTPLESESPLYIDGQRATFSLDGMAISAQMAQNIINSGWIGGQMGLTQILLQQGDPRLSHFQVGDMLYHGNLAGANLAIGEAIETGNSIIRNWVVNDSISLNWSVIYYQTQKQKPVEEIQLQSQGKRKLNGNEKKSLKGEIDEMLARKNGNKTCLEKLEELLDALGSKHATYSGMLSDILLDNNGFSLRRTKKPYASRTETKNKIITAPSASALGRSIVLNALNDFNSESGIYQNALDVIHESFHSARNDNYSHWEIATAIAGVEGLDINKYKQWNGGKEEIGGGFLNSFIEKYCKEGGSKNWTGWLERFK